MEKKIYNSKKEKVIDFLIGFFGVPIISSIIIGIPVAIIGFFSADAYILQAIVVMSILLAELVACVYVGRKRKYLGLGILLAVVGIPLILFGTCLASAGGASFLGALFRR